MTANPPDPDPQPFPDDSTGPAVEAKQDPAGHAGVPEQMTTRDKIERRLALSPFGILVTGAALILFLAAFLSARPTLAFLGLALTAWSAAARAHQVHAPVSLQRRLPVSAGLSVPVTLKTWALSPGEAILEVRTRVPEGFRVIERDAPPGRGEAFERLVVVPERPGTAAWDRTEVQTGDRWGLWSLRHMVRRDDRMRVSPEPHWQKTGKQAGRGRTVAQLVKSRFAMELDLEVQGVREFRGGDRLRDMDWPRSARGTGLFVRERERVAPRPVLVLLDATRTMRWPRLHAKTKTASRIATSVLAAAGAAGVRAELVVFDDQQVHRASQTRGQASGSRVLGQLARLPSQEPPSPAPAAPVLLQNPSGHRSGVQLENGSPLPRDAQDPRRLRDEEADGPADDEILGKTRPRGGSVAAKALAEVQKRLGGPGLVVAILDGELAPQRFLVVLERLTRAGHEVVAVVPSTGAHHYRRHEAKRDVLARLRELQAVRESLAQATMRHRGHFFVAYPKGERELVREVATRFR